MREISPKVTRAELLIAMLIWVPLITASRTSKTPKSGDKSISTEKRNLMVTPTDLITTQQPQLQHQSRKRSPKFPPTELHIIKHTVIVRNLSQKRLPKRPLQRKYPNPRLPARNLPLQRKKSRKRSLKRPEPAASLRKPPRFSSQKQIPKRYPRNAWDDPRSVRLPKSQRDLKSKQDPKTSRNLRDISLSIRKRLERSVEKIDKSSPSSEKKTAKPCVKKLLQTDRTPRKKLLLQRKI